MKDWNIQTTKIAARTINPIRLTIDTIKMPTKEALEKKKMINLGIGDPTRYGNMDINDEFVGYIKDNMKDKKKYGYAPPHGQIEAREALAKKYSLIDEDNDEEKGNKDGKLTPEDVFIASGCSGAIKLTLPSLADKGENILLPEPGFPLYTTICLHYGIEPRFYKLDGDDGWNIDLKDLDKNIDDKTRGIVVINPSNPCGSVYTKEHLQDILAVAEKHKVPIVADEIYGEIVFSGSTFYPMASLTTEVPVISLGGFAKKYSVPGWRIGWALLYDRKDRLKNTRKALQALARVILGSTTIIQAAIPDILEKFDNSFITNNVKQLEKRAISFYDRISKIKGLKPNKPAGALYLMIKLDLDILNVKNDTDYVQKLLLDQHVLVLPGECFGVKGWFRVVLCAPDNMLQDAADRIEQFTKTLIE